MSGGATGPALDVVIPVRTGVELLPEAVASVLAQDGVETRLVVVDDGAGVDLAGLLGDPDPARVRIVLNAGAPGVGGARNTGVAVGSADLVAFLDADDLWPAGRVRLLLDALGTGTDGRPDVGIAFGTVALCDRDGRRLGERRAPTAGAVLVHRAAWDRVGPFATGLPVGEFIDWVSRARATGIRERWTDGIVLLRRSHGGNMTRTASAAGYVEVARAHLRRSDRS